VSARGLELLAQADISAEAAIFAAQAARVALDSAHQVVGAIGFTLEFPLQRAYRRAGAMQTWLEQAVEDWSPE
jgi:alkylation response protein AidB-like acyl-CoA dehydrogenase